ncbi:hypothetical protein SK128_005282 [Halocaridina rubra]|uniref:Uncharacterized protein n=1 Tax=Halocaridina rubra TaxID=373956 RepID=A0AAN8WI52_HALRR
MPSVFMPSTVLVFPRTVNIFRDDSVVVSGWSATNLHFQNNTLLSVQDILDSDTSCASLADTLLRLVDQVDAFYGSDNATINPDDYLCTKGSAIRAFDTGIPMSRRDQTGAYYLIGIGAPLNFCNGFVGNLFTKITPDSTFLNLALQ